MDEKPLKHLEIAEIARLLNAEPEICRHLAEACAICGERLQQIDALLKRFQHWDPEIVVLEGLPAEGLFATILAAGHDGAAWLSQVDAREELQTWGVAWIALEKAREGIKEESAGSRARDLALLAVRIAESLGDRYHPESVADLKARAYAAAAVTALEKGSGDETVARDVSDLISRLIR